jgi:putative transposase
MPRPQRVRLAGVPQHVIQRGNNRQATFFDNSDYRRYLECLKEAGERTGCAIHAYVLLSNHVSRLRLHPGNGDDRERKRKMMSRQKIESDPPFFAHIFC